MKTTIIIIAYALTLIGGLTGLSVYYSSKPIEKTNVKNFVGIDSNGNRHYPDGSVEWVSNY